MAKKDLIDLAKSGTATAKKPVARKPRAKKPAVKKPTANELRDQKAKETVEKLLEDSPIITLETKDELLELDETVVEELKGVEWLEDQVTLLTEKNSALDAELKLVQVENQQFRSAGGGNDGDVKTAIIELFNEIQENHIKLGVDNQGIGNFRIYCPGFLNRLITFFPFLKQHKKFQ